MCLLMFFPIYWMLICSFVPGSRLLVMPPAFFSSNVTLDSYSKVFSNPRYMTYLKNSLIVSFFTVLITLSLAIPSGYAFSRYRFHFKNGLLTVLMSSQIFPIVVMMITIYSLFMNLKLLNTRVGLILADVAATLPLAITMLKSFYDTIPTTLDEAAKVDGASRMRVLTNIVFPLVKPGLISVAIYTFMAAWDDYLMASIIMQKSEMRTITVGIAEAFFGEYSYDYSAMMAFVVFASIPAIIGFSSVQKYLISGLTEGAVKG